MLNIVTEGDGKVPYEYLGGCVLIKAKPNLFAIPMEVNGVDVTNLLESFGRDGVYKIIDIFSATKVSVRSSEVQASIGIIMPLIVVCGALVTNAVYFFCRG